MTNTNTKDKEIMPALTAVIVPELDGDRALQLWKQYQDIINKVCEDSDYQLIQGKKFRKKSGWRKIAAFMGISVDIVESTHETIGKTFAWHFTCKAIHAKSGRYAIGTGSCDAFEKAKLMEGKYMIYNRFNRVWEEAQPNSIHNIRTTAETRAFNRAVSNLVGGGELSADEIINEEEEPNGNGHNYNGNDSSTSATQSSAAYVCKNASIHGSTIMTITLQEANYSVKRFGMELCRQCQALKKGEELK